MITCKLMKDGEEARAAARRAYRRTRRVSYRAMWPDGTETLWDGYGIFGWAGAIRGNPPSSILYLYGLSTDPTIMEAQLAKDTVKGRRMLVALQVLNAPEKEDEDMATKGAAKKAPAKKAAKSRRKEWKKGDTTSAGCEVLGIRDNPEGTHGHTRILILKCQESGKKFEAFTQDAHQVRYHPDVREKMKAAKRLAAKNGKTEAKAKPKAKAKSEAKSKK